MTPLNFTKILCSSGIHGKRGWAPPNRPWKRRGEDGSYSERFHDDRESGPKDNKVVDPRCRRVAAKGRMIVEVLQEFRRVDRETGKGVLGTLPGMSRILIKGMVVSCATQKNNLRFRIRICVVRISQIGH
jgi:hypothetical protein